MRTTLQFSVEVIAASGPVFFELHRLCNGFVRVDTQLVRRESDRVRIAVLRHVGAPPAAAPSAAPAFKVRRPSLRTRAQPNKTVVPSTTCASTMTCTR